MENLTMGLIGIGLLMATALVAFVIYRWRQETRVSRINAWVNDYLRVRYGDLPAHVRINCSHDSFWPVLVGLDTPGTGVRHHLQFACRGPQSAWSLLSEKDERQESS